MHNDVDVYKTCAPCNSSDMIKFIVSRGQLSLLSARQIRGTQEEEEETLCKHIKHYMNRRPLQEHSLTSDLISAACKYKQYETLLTFLKFFKDVGSNDNLVTAISTCDPICCKQYRVYCGQDRSVEVICVCLLWTLVNEVQRNKAKCVCLFMFWGGEMLIEVVNYSIDVVECWFNML